MSLIPNFTISGLTGVQGIYVDNSNNLYTCNGSLNTVGKYNATTGVPINGNFITGISNPTAITGDLSNNLYIGPWSTGINKYNLSNGSLITSNFISSVFLPSISIYNGIIYLSQNYNINTYNLSGTSINTSFITTPSYTRQSCILNGNLFFGDSDGTIRKYNISSGTAISIFTITINTTLYVVHSCAVDNNNNLYASPDGVSINQYNATTGNLITGNLISGLSNISNIFVSNNFLYVSGNNSVKQFTLPGPPPPPPIPIILCFKEDSKILTRDGYVPVQTLNPGDFVKTVNDGYIRIHKISKREVKHEAQECRIKNQLYKCSTSDFSEVFEDLVITGCHSILVDDFADEKQKSRVIEINGDTYVTDNKYRLPACVDYRTSVYETPGTYTVYHIALEHEDEYMNYGIYANGLLVESCSKIHIKDFFSG
jgi:hypothetical protein